MGTQHIANICKFKDFTHSKLYRNVQDYKTKVDKITVLLSCHTGDKQNYQSFYSSHTHAILYRCAELANTSPKVH